MTKETLDYLSLCAVNTATGKSYVSADVLRALLSEREALLAALRYIEGRLPAHDTKSIAQARAAIAKATGKEAV